MLKISAFVPTYNSETTIKATLESLLNQKYPFEEIRVYDNQSKDKTRDIVQALIEKNHNLKLIVNEVNLGAEGNFSKCISEANNDYCILAHADDIYDEKFNLEMISFLQSDSSLVAAFCAANEIDENGNIFGRRFVPSELIKKESTRMDKNSATYLFYKYGNFITCPSVIVKSEVYREKIKNWNGEAYKTSADLDVWFRLLDFGNIGFLNKYLINYRVANASFSFRIAKVRTYRHDLFLVLMANKNLVYAERNKENLNFLLNKDDANRFLNLLRTKKLELIKEYKWTTECRFRDLIAGGLQSTWHLKMLSAILLLRLVYKMVHIYE